MQNSEVAQPYLTFSDPMDCSLPGSSIHGIFQGRVYISTPCSLAQICKFLLLGTLDEGYCDLSVLYLTNSCQSKVKSKFET